MRHEEDEQVRHDDRPGQEIERRAEAIAVGEACTALMTTPDPEGVLGRYRDRDEERS